MASSTAFSMAFSSSWTSVLRMLLISALVLLTLARPAADDNECKKFGITFDIDGVLRHTDKALPFAGETLWTLKNAGVPFTVLTNGGGQPESIKAADLSNSLGINISAEHYIQSHTPFQDLAPKFADKTVLILTQDAQKGRSVMKEYGFGSIITTCDLHWAYPTLWPFLPGPDISEACAEPLPKPVYESGPHAPADDADLAPFLKVDAIFVINDPAWWSLDLQIVMDLLYSHAGYLGTVSSTNGQDGLWHQDGQPEIFFSASDLEFKAKWGVPRFGQGSFIASLKGIWRAKGGDAAAFRHEIHGKPQSSQYLFVERREKEIQIRETGRHCILERNYMIGDNPESDIRGAMEYKSPQGTQWLGILVKTGVWDGVSEPSYEPSYRVDNVKDAIELIGTLEGVDLTVRDNAATAGTFDDPLSPASTSSAVVPRCTMAPGQNCPRRGWRSKSPMENGGFKHRFPPL